MLRRPLLALSLGDPAGIGPEICLRAVEDPAVRAAARVVLVGPSAIAPVDMARVTREDMARVPRLDMARATRERGAAVTLEGDVAYLAADPPRGPEPWSIGVPQASAGRAALAALRAGHELALAGEVDALVTAPVSKEALHLAGEQVEGQTELLGRWAGAPDVEMLAVARELRVLLLTRHLPLREALARVTTQRVIERLRLLDTSLRAFGFPRPRLALAGLNPHAGENGILGREEIDLLRPAVAQARSEGLDVSGPESPDTVFLRASRGTHDAVLALYHDQAFIPIKLHAPEEGLTVLVGMPYLRISPAHGTAFDIAGRGLARHANLVAALLQAAHWTHHPKET